MWFIDEPNPAAWELFISTLSLFFDCPEREGGAVQPSAISEDDFDVKKCPLPSWMLFQVVELGKDRAEGSPPPEDGWEWFSWIVFISTSLMPDLTSGLKGVGRVRQECGESEHRCACASVSGARTCVPHVVLRCSAVVQAARRSPQVHKSHLSLMCVCDSGANTCYQSAPVRAAWRRVDGFTRACAQTGSRGGGGVEVSIEERRTKQKMAGRDRKQKRVQKKKTNGKIRFQETGSSWFTYRSNAKWRVW